MPGTAAAYLAVFREYQQSPTKFEDQLCLLLLRLDEADRGLHRQLHHALMNWVIRLLSRMYFVSLGS